MLVTFKVRCFGFFKPKSHLYYIYSVVSDFKENHIDK